MVNEEVDSGWSAERWAHDILLRYSADVASTFLWVVTYGIRTRLVTSCGFRDTISQSGP